MERIEDDKIPMVEVQKDGNTYRNLWPKKGKMTKGILPLQDEQYVLVRKSYKGGLEKEGKSKNGGQTFKYYICAFTVLRETKPNVEASMLMYESDHEKFLQAGDKGDVIKIIGDHYQDKNGEDRVGLSFELHEEAEDDEVEEGKPESVEFNENETL